MKNYSTLNDVRNEIDLLDKSILDELTEMFFNKNLYSKQHCLNSKNKILKGEWNKSNDELLKGYSIGVEIVRMKALKLCFDQLCEF